MTDDTRWGPTVEGDDADRLPKLCGADVELGNFILGVERANGSGGEAARALLREFHGFPDTRPPDRWTAPRYGGHERDARDTREALYHREHDRYTYDASATDPRWTGTSGRGGTSPIGVQYQLQDWGRRFLVNGGCAYIDLDHLEICLPEVLSARDFVAAWHAMLMTTRQALTQANARQPRGRRLQVLVNTSDGSGNSYGSHLNVLITARAFDNLFCRKLQYLLYLAAFHASAIVFTGQGKVGSENGRPPADFQVSQRADFLEALVGPQTTCRRPIINSRDEPLCGSRYPYAYGARGGGMARLHVIAYDSTLSQVATFLKIGTLQIVLAMIEAECVDRDLALDDPLDAVVRWSHDPTLAARARTTSGGEVTAVGLQQKFLEAAARFVARGGCAGVVPDAELILDTWARTLDDLDARNWDALAGRLDWVRKRALLVGTMQRHPHLAWTSPEIKHLDLMYSSLDEDEGLYWACERAGAVDRIVEPDAIAARVAAPPENTRAWTRGALLARAGPGEVTAANWDRIDFSLTDGRGWRRLRSLDLANPLGWTRQATEEVFRRTSGLDAALEGLDALKPASVIEPGYHGSTDATYSSSALVRRLPSEAAPQTDKPTRFAPLR
jgi:proteasome accessory factor A